MTWKRFAWVFGFAALLAGGAFAIDWLRGGFLGSLALTSVDPRSLWSQYEQSVSDAPRTFELPSPPWSRAAIAAAGGTAPKLVFRIPKVYLNRVTPNNDGSGLASVGLNVVSTTLEPWRTGLPRIVRDAPARADGMSRGDSRALLASKIYEMNIILYTDPTLTVAQREKQLKDFLFSSWHPPENCVRTAGPTPNVVVYTTREGVRPLWSCLNGAFNSSAFGWEIMEDGALAKIILCRDPPISICDAAGFRRGQWFFRISFPSVLVGEALEQLRRADELVATFEVDASSHGERN